MRLYLSKVTRADGSLLSPITILAANKADAENAIKASGAVDADDKLDTRHLDDMHREFFGRGVDARDDGAVRSHSAIEWSHDGPLSPITAFGKTPTED